MAAVLREGVRYLRQGIGVVKQPARSIHIPSVPRPIFTETRTFFSRLLSNLIPPNLSAQHALVRPTPFSNFHSINSRLSLPAKHALSRPFAPPRLPKPPVVPANVTQVGLGTARAFHSGRPIFQNMVDNVPIATRALWEAEWDLKMKKKEARRMRRAAQNKTVSKSCEMLKPKHRPSVAELQCGPSELDVYFPVQPTSAVITHLFVPLAPTPTPRLPLSAHTDSGSAHPLLPIADLAAVHTSHRLHSLRVSTLFSRLDAANVWGDPGVNVDAYAFGPRYDALDAQEKQCTVLRVTFRGWKAARVRSILGDSAEEWYSLEETDPDGHPTFVPPTFVPLPDSRQDVSMSVHSESPPPESVEIGSISASQVEVDNVRDVSAPPIRASASAQHDLVLPTLDFSSAFVDAMDNDLQPPQSYIFFRTVSRDAESVSQSSSVLMEGSWECLDLDL